MVQRKTGMIGWLNSRSNSLWARSKCLENRELRMEIRCLETNQGKLLAANVTSIEEINSPISIRIPEYYFVSLFKGNTEGCPGINQEIVLLLSSQFQPLPLPLPFAIPSTVDVTTRESRWGCKREVRKVTSACDLGRRQWKENLAFHCL